MTWQEALTTKRVRWALAFSIAVLLMMVFYMPTFYKEIIGPKKGYYLDDPFLKLFDPTDWSLLIFATLYLTVIQTLTTSLKKPEVMIIGLTTYCAISVTRMFTMYMLTLEPPTGMILLVDPVTASLVYPDSTFAKDLFFSGHVSTMMVLVLVEQNRIARFLKIAGTSLVGILLAWQQVHYTLDLVVAPFVTYAVFISVKRILSLEVDQIIPTKLV
jgi:hypothetical protein